MKKKIIILFSFLLTLQRIIFASEGLTLTKEVFLSQSGDPETTKRSFAERVYDTVSCEPLLGDSEKREIVYKYLRGKNMYKEKPDGIMYRQAVPFIEYYLDDQNNKMSFVIHIWDDYFVDSESKATVFTNAILCTTLYKDELTKIGTLTSTYRENGTVISKQLSDLKNGELAYFEYQYVSGVPFPFIIEEKISIDDKELINSLSEVFHEYWLYKEKAIFNEMEEWIRYDGNIFLQSNDGTFECLSNENGMLEKMKEPLNGSDLERKERPNDYRLSSEVSILYDENRKLESLNYWRSSMNYSTWYNWGTKHYDEQQRILYASYSVTHGFHDRFYLYHDTEPQPWICIEICSMPYSASDTESTAYGHEVSFVLLQ